MLTTYDGTKIRVACESPRDDDNYQRVDRAVSAALSEHFVACGYVTVGDVQ